MTYVSDKLYKTITDSIPIVCVDMIPVRKVDEEWELGVITRATGLEKGKLAIIGGRVQHNESLNDAIYRHLGDSLDISHFSFTQHNSIEKPFRVHQYFHQLSAQSLVGFDPSKHAVALTYMISITEEPAPRDEASAYHWIRSDQTHGNFGYNQDQVIESAFNLLAD